MKNQYKNDNEFSENRKQMLEILFGIIDGLIISIGLTLLRFMFCD